MTHNIVHMNPVVVRSISRKVRDVAVQMEPVARSVTHVLGMSRRSLKGEVA